MLYTNLHHLETATDFHKTIDENRKVLVICGRMDPQGIQLFRLAEELGAKYGEVKFCDMEFDNPESKFLCELAEVAGMTTIPHILF